MVIEKYEKNKYLFTADDLIWVKTRLKDKQMTVGDLARKLNKSIQRVSNIINGRCYVKWETVAKIYEVIGDPKDYEIQM